MLTNAMALIMADHDRVHLGDLTQPRALAAVPFGGRYRIIDFALSSLVNSGIKNIGIVAMTKYKSLLDHIGTGASWDLDRMFHGLQILPPYINSSYFNKEGGDLTGLIEFVLRGRQEYVVLANCNMIMNMDVAEIVQAHIDGKCDMTVAYNRDGMQIGSPHYQLTLERGIVKDVLLDMEVKGQVRSAIGVMVLSRALLLDYLQLSQARGINSFSLEAMLKLYGEYRIKGYEYKGTCLRINSVAGYFRNSLRLLDPEIRAELFNPERPIYTKVKNEGPAFYGPGNDVSQALISDGCSIEGSVERSILFRRAKIGKNAVVKNCIIMQGAEVGEGAELCNVILDKDTVIRPGIELQGQPDYPLVVAKGVTL